MAITYTRSFSPTKPTSYLGGLKTVTAKTSDYTVTAAESGTIFTTEGAGGAVNFTLPSQGAGLHYWFTNAEDQNMTITADTADTMVTFNDVAADSVAFSTSSEKVGGAAFVFSDGSKWMVQLMTYDGADQAVTIAT